MKLYTAKPTIDDKTCDDVVRVLKSGMIAQGPKVKELEEKFAEYCGVKHCAAVNSGTAALHAALFAAGIKEGDEVITTPFTFIATANTILMTGAKPVFVDIDVNTFNIDPKKIRAKITPKTKAIMPVHLYGLMAEMDEILKIAEEHDLIVIEDGAQAHGSAINNQLSGSFGHMGAFSLYATKNMMCAEGGLVTSNNADYIEKVKSFRHHGQHPDQRYNYLDFGYNYRMTDIHAVIGLNQFEQLPDFNAKRKRNAAIYNSILGTTPGISIPFINEGYNHVFHQYTIKVNPSEYGRTREELVAELNRNEVYPGIFYPMSLHLVSTFTKFGYAAGDFPVSENMSTCVMSLPVHPYIDEQDITRVAEVIRQFKK